MQTQNGKAELRIGAVAYAPKVVTIWEGMREFLHSRGLQTEYVLYSSYPALVDALAAGHIDIAWNTPLAYLQARERLGGQCLVLGMRDSDVNFTTVFITRTDSPIHSLNDLKGKRFALASRDSSHAAILPVHFLRAGGLDPERDLKLLRFVQPLQFYCTGGTCPVAGRTVHQSHPSHGLQRSSVEAGHEPGGFDPMAAGKHCGLR